MQSFLQLLAASPLEKREYKPAIEHTDDYPSRKVEIKLVSESVEFFSQSQGEFAIPWALKFGGATYVISAKNPAEAFAKLKPYL